ncbi:MAG: nucleotidyltransferase family protein [Acidimicrobiales bacterium]
MGDDLELSQKIEAIAEVLDDNGIDHAFGGALALAYHAQPRATDDIDVNIFVSSQRAGEVLALLGSLSTLVDVEVDISQIQSGDWGRIYWGEVAIDFFFSYEDYHDEARRRAQTVPFGSTSIKVLSATDLALFKVIFNRDNDWSDIAAMQRAGAEIDGPWLLGEIEKIFRGRRMRAVRSRLIDVLTIPAKSSSRQPEARPSFLGRLFGHGTDRVVKRPIERHVSPRPPQPVCLGRVKWNGRPCILSPGHKGNHRSV